MKPEYDAQLLDSLVLYADNHLLAVNKPKGLLTQDSGTGKRNLEDWAREWVRVDKQKTGNIFLNAVHRIDQVVSGVVLFARTSKALTRLNVAVRNQQCEKVYHALVEGQPKQREALLTHFLARGKHRANVVKSSQSDAKKAILKYKLIDQYPKNSLLEVELKTGRYHQIRAQLAAIGCPIVGDVKYGAQSVHAKLGIALHHERLCIEHPVTHKNMIFIAGLFSEFGWDAYL